MKFQAIAGESEQGWVGCTQEIFRSFLYRSLIMLPFIRLARIPFFSCPKCSGLGRHRIFTPTNATAMEKLRARVGVHLQILQIFLSLNSVLIIRKNRRRKCQLPIWLDIRGTIRFSLDILSPSPFIFKWRSTLATG